MKPIFISYSSRDTHFLKGMRDSLIRAGYKPWIDPNPRPGLDWKPEIDQAIRSAQAVVVIVTPAAADSIYVTYEWSLALAVDVPVIPVLFKETSMHPRLRTVTPRFEYIGWNDPQQFWDYFVREIQRLLAPGRTGALPQQPASNQSVPSPNPPVTNLTYDRSIMPTNPGYWIVVRRGPQLNQMVRLDKEIITLGRDIANDITINDPEVSRFHIRFTWRDGAYFIEDLNSTNGTLIDGQRITSPTPLRSGKAILLGDSVLLSYEVVY